MLRSGTALAWRLQHFVSTDIPARQRPSTRCANARTHAAQPRAGLSTRRGELRYRYPSAGHCNVYRDCIAAILRHLDAGICRYRFCRMTNRSDARHAVRVSVLAALWTPATDVRLMNRSLALTRITCIQRRILTQKAGLGVFAPLAAALSGASCRSRRTEATFIRLPWPGRRILDEQRCYS